MIKPCKKRVGLCNLVGTRSSVSLDPCPSLQFMLDIVLEHIFQRKTWCDNNFRTKRINNINHVEAKLERKKRKKKSLKEKKVEKVLMYSFRRKKNQGS